MTTIPPLVTEPELAAWLTHNIGLTVSDDYGTAEQILTAFDLAATDSPSLNNPHRITDAIGDARDTSDGPWTFKPIPATAAATELLVRFRITRKPANHTQLLVDLPAPVVVSRHQCPFCRRFTRADAAQVRDHMTRCWQNPALRCCKTCVHKNEAGPEDDEACTHPDGPEPEDYRFPVLHCPIWAPKGA
jgi:hypothetical protein